MARTVAAFLCLLAVAAPLALAADDQVAAAQGVIERVFGATAAASFSLSLLPQARAPLGRGVLGGQNDTFIVAAANGRVTVQGTSGVALAAGAYWYAKHVGNCQVTWGENRTGSNTALPSPLPDVKSTMVTTAVPWRYAWNVVTFQYTAVWWDEERWIQEIDWLALHGNNLPLALVGLEYVWLQVFNRLGVSLAELEAWFTGPAFLAWQRMGNIRKFAGPLSNHWLTQQMQLQKKIVARMRALGMKPVLPCFSGHVPQAIQRVYPNASYRQSPAWNNFPPDMSDVWLVDPADPLFMKLGRMFQEEVVNLYGASGFYSCDTFNEVNPTSSDPSYLRAAGAAVSTAIRSVDPDGVWVMQAWLFRFAFWQYDLVQAYLSGVPNDGMLILDLCSEDGALAPQFSQYFGKAWVWNLLHNYGGVRGVYGNLSRVATGPMADLTAAGSTMIGIGFTPEAILQNPVMYELLTDTFYTTTPIDVDNWLGAYVSQRYGLADPYRTSPAYQAWSLLRAAVYNQPGEPRADLEHIPTSGLQETPDFGWQNGDATGMFRAWTTLLTVANASGSAAPSPAAAVNGPFQYDLVDVTRQSVTMFFSDVHRMFCNMVANMGDGGSEDKAALWKIANLMLELIQQLDSLLGTNPNYLLGVWQARASARAHNASEAALFDFNGKNQITMWGPNAQITDYAAKAWQGLYGDYYYRRWQLFFNQLIDGGIDQWDRFAFDNALLAMETTWCHNGTRYSPVPTPAIAPGQAAINIATALHRKVTTTPSGCFVKYANSDVQGQDYDYTPMWTTDVEQLKVLCLVTATCQGFNTNGYLKLSSQGRISTTASDFYARSSNC